MSTGPDPHYVLLVDDLQDNLVALEALLRWPDVELLEAHSGREALELLLVHEVSLALIDVQMPEMDGFELAELMRGMARTKHVPIIFITAGTHDPKRVFKGYETGAVDFLFKPIEPRSLRGKVEVFLELASQRRELAEALRLNELFVAIVGHDLRNPLNAIRTGVDLLRDLEPTPAQARVLARMDGSSRRMTEMIDELLDLTRARLGGGLAFARAQRKVHIHELVARASDELRDASGKNRIRIAAETGSVTSGNPDRLLQLFSNVLANAVAHGHRDRPIDVSIGGGPDEIVVSVANDGAIAPELIPSLFEPFRARQRSDRSGGLGLGMFIARQIAIAHRGSIVAEPTRDDRTVVTIRLPRHAGDVPEPARAPDAACAPDAKTILIVDDESDVRELMREAFERDQYRVETACNGKEALDLMLRDTMVPDVLVMDLAMPVLDGNALYRAMQQNPRLSAIPVVVSTADPAHAPAGPLVLPKPVKLARLLHEVAQLGTRHRAAHT